MERKGILWGEKLMETKKDIVRCAIYCRKSVEKGLDMEFNTLDAQREAAEAYIASQKANGWVCLPEHYDDGGFSGGNLNRPGLKKLLRDCEAGKVDVIVIYKIDRLSRSLCDFADLSRFFEKWNVAFVSVTQEINTQTSAGRMMLNILMTFAQFEREMISSRIKDKMAATRKKGKWVGGSVPFGYYTHDKRLVVDKNRAPIVQRIFQRYLEIQAPRQIARELNADGIKTVVGKDWGRQSIYNILNNHTYVGDVFYEGQVYPGEQDAIIDRETWELTQAFLKANAPGGDKRRPSTSEAALSGIIRCGHCNGAMIGVSSKRWGRVYHYYQCVKDKERDVSVCPIKEIRAGDIEALVCEHLLPVIQSPEVVAAVSKLSGVRPKDVLHTFEDGFWNELTTVEKQRLMQIMLERVVVNEDDVTIEYRTENIKSIQEAYNVPQNS